MKTLSPFLGLAIVLASLTGCNGTLATSTTPSLTTGGSSSTAGDGDLIFGPGADGQVGFGMGGPGGGLSQYLADLDLTADQQTQIDAVDAQNQPGAGQTPPSGAPAAGTDLVSVLTADTLDVAALRTALTQATSMGGGMGGDRQVTTAEAYYDILTATQRAALATQLEASAASQPAGAPAGGQPPMNGAGDLDVTALHLTTLQQATWDAYQAKAGTATAAPRDPGAQNAALAAYFKSGDEAALEAAFTASTGVSGFPVDEFIAFAGSLTAAQRQTAFANGVPGLSGGPGGMGMPPQN